MQDVVYYGGKLPAKPGDDIEWAVEKINEYQYRKEFGLTKQEMLDEPLEDVYINSMIIKFIDSKAKREEQRQLAKSKLNGRRKR